MNKENIINNCGKAEFEAFLRNDTTGKVLEFFDNEGITALKNSELKEDRIRYILSFSPYRNELLKNIDFLDVFLKTNLNLYYSNLKYLNDDTYDFILNRCIQLGFYSYKMADLFNDFKLEYKLKMLEQWPYSAELLYDVLKGTRDPKVINKIIHNYNIDLTSYNINISAFFQNAEISVIESYSKRNTEGLDIEAVSVPVAMITNQLAEKIWKENNIFQARAIINSAEHSTDISKLNAYIKYKEQQVIASYTDDLQTPFKEIYETFKNYKIAELNDDHEEYRKAWPAFRDIINKIDDIKEEQLEELYEQGGIEEVKRYLSKINDNNLSNYIIDYHFEENFHNITIDIKELLNFYYNGQIVIPEERVEIYNKISNIDYLTAKEKIELHEILKHYNMMEVFYDDMSLARKIVAEAIKDYSLTHEVLKQYQDSELTQKYGVDVYNLNGQQFFGIVKTGRVVSDLLPTGHSYSLVGNGGIAVFGDVKDSKTFLYDAADLNPNQIVHVFPCDSYTFYRPFQQHYGATRRVNMLAMPDEVVSISKSYTELLILEKGTKQTDMDNNLPNLKKIALYCMDEIREQDVYNAQCAGVGIVLINSGKYKHNGYDTFNSYHRDFDKHDNEQNYFNGFTETEKFEARR